MVRSNVGYSHDKAGVAPTLLSALLPRHPLRLKQRINEWRDRSARKQDEHS
jgi:hypothetical protein